MDNDASGIELRNRAHLLCSEHLGGVWSRISNSEIEITQIRYVTWLYRHIMFFVLKELTRYNICVKITRLAENIVNLRTFSGGASNLLYCCHLAKDIVVANGEPSQILIRFYGDQSKTDEIAIQCRIFDMLSRQSLGPKLYGTFEGGRLEEFLPANSLTCNEIRDPEISRIISEKLAVVHSLNVPINKDESWLIERLQEWTEDISSDIESIGIVEHSKDTARKLLSIDFQREIQFIKEEVFEKSTSIKVFSHNDLHQGNILFAEPSKQRPTLKERIVFIDFEYCSYNYRAYDIANHLCEWLFQYGDQDYPHFTCYQEKFPTRDEQLNFIHHYLSEIIKIQTHTRKIEQTYEGARGQTLNRRQEERGQEEEEDESKCLEFDELEEEIVVEEDEDEQEEEEVVEKEEEAEYDDDYILCNDRREIIGDIRSTRNNKNRNSPYETSNGHLDGEATTISMKTPSKQRHQQIGTLTKTTKSSFSNTIRPSLISENEEEKLFEEIQPFYMAVSLFWTLWCIKQAQTSAIKFGYWEHAMNRWNLYNLFKSSHNNTLSKGLSNPSSKENKKY